MYLCNIREHRFAQSKIKLNDQITLNFDICIHSNYENPCKGTEVQKATCVWSKMFRHSESWTLCVLVSKIILNI